MGNQKFLLDPNETAMQNLFRAADYAVRYILSRKRIKLKSDDEWEELHNRCVYKGVSIFLSRYIGNHKYDRSFSFYQNVYSAVWSCVTLVVTSFFDEIKDRLNSTDQMATLAYDQDRHTLAYADKKRSPILTAVERETLGFDHVTAWNAEDALNYIWSCEDEAAEYDNKTIDYAANLEHRKSILDRVDSLLRKGRTDEQYNDLKYYHEYHKNRMGRTRFPSSRQCSCRDSIRGAKHL